jgi:predicted transcriptional regulator
MGIDFDFRKARLVLELRQSDVARGTGITVRAIASAERGEYINPHERGILLRYYVARLKDEMGLSGDGVAIQLLK